MRIQIARSRKFMHLLIHLLFPGGRHEQYGVGCPVLCPHPAVIGGQPRPRPRSPLQSQEHVRQHTQMF